MGLTDLKKELKTLEKDQLIALIADLYKKSKAAREYLDFYVQPNERERFEKYRNKVVEAFFPKRGYQLRLREGKQALSDFQKLSRRPSWWPICCWCMWKRACGLPTSTATSTRLFIPAWKTPTPKP